MTTVETRAGITALSATGGSARSQLDQLNERSWKPRPRVAFFVVAASFVVPLISALVAVQIVARLVRRPAGTGPLLAWLGALIMIAVLISRGVERVSRRLLPLATMLRLSLVFPDQAPSRFAVTLKTGSGKALEHALKRADTDKQFSTSEHAAALVVGMISSVRAHDRLTRGHCERVRAYADLIGEELGLDADSKNKLHWAALLHDIGKLDVPAAILNKTERLTADEWEISRTHPGASAKWIEPLRPWLGEWALAASEHHERYDGDGYPLRLRGEEISLAGRIVAVADAFDVMTAARSYKTPFPSAQARAELANNAGTQFDPKIVRAFLSISLGRLRSLMGPLAGLSGVSGLFSVGGVTSVATAALTASAAVATAFAAPAAAAPTRHGARAIAGGGSAATAAGPASHGRSGSASPRSPGSSHRAPPGSHGGSSRGGGIGRGAGTGDPSQPGTGAPSGSSPTTTPSDPGGTGTSPTPTTVDPLNPTPTTTPGSAPDPTPTTSPVTVAPPTTAPPTPHAPIANDDHVGPFLQANVVIDVLLNDTDPDGDIDKKTLVIVTYPSGGYQSIDVSDHKIRIKVNALYTGTLVFTYRVCDLTSLCSQATVTAKFTLGP